MGTFDSGGGFFGASCWGVESRRSIVTMELRRLRVGAVLLFKRFPASLNFCLNCDGKLGFISKTHYHTKELQHTRSKKTGLFRLPSSTSLPLCPNEVK